MQLLFECSVATSLTAMQSQTWSLFLSVQVRILDKIQQQLTAANLPPLEWYDVLWVLQDEPEQKMRLSDLADRVLLTRSNLTRLLDRLEKKNLVQREPCPSDRRGMFAVLTEAGATMRRQMWAVYSAAIAEHFAEPLTDEEVSALHQVLKKLKTANSS